MLYEILISSFGGFIFLIPILYFLVTKEEHSFNHSILLFVAKDTHKHNDTY